VSAATALGKRLAARISRSGPIDVADYFIACLHDPEHGYYRRKQAIGGGGDFVTAPEITQIFGELVGLWSAVVWQQMGMPATVRLVELGPGRGTLMRDALRAARLVPGFRSALRVELVEINEQLIAEQRSALTGAEVPIRWTSTLEAGEGASIVIANEFLDTLPIQQHIFERAAWRRRQVGLDEQGQLAFVTRTAEAFDLPEGAPEPSECDVFEERGDGLRALAASLHSTGAPVAALFIDYGHAAAGFGDTLQAMSAHSYADPLAAPGENDLTSHVDFAAVVDAMRDAGFAADGPATQAEFLGRLGIVERASRLMSANSSRAAEIEGAVSRLIAPGGMGTRFLVLGIRSKELPPLPGL
jgi:SAM-dependent MidA family methyltransferase